MSRFFLSYRRKGDDAELAGRIQAWLREKGHDVFMDINLPVGTDWVREISRANDECEYFVVLLSEESMGREMVVAEVRQAHDRNKATGSPKIVPIRIRFTGRLDYELDAYLGRLNYVLWNGRDDDAKVLAAIEQVIAGAETKSSVPQSVPLVAPSIPPTPSLRPTPAVDPRKLKAPGEAMASNDPLYQPRHGDKQVEALLESEESNAGGGQTLTIRGPFQRGKSSLLIRYLEACMAREKKIAFVDFQLFGSSDFENYKTFLTTLANALVGSLEVDLGIPEMRATQDMIGFVQKSLLPAIAGPVVFAFDEAERVVGTPSQNDFFTMFRAWHNNRANPVTRRKWGKVDLALVISTETAHLINHANASPWNAGLVVDLDSFTLSECHDLNRRHPASLPDSQVEQLYVLLGGHPYLTRLAYHKLLVGDLRFDELMEQAARPEGPFGDHLRALLAKIGKEPDLLQAFQGIVNDGTAPEPIAERLRNAGLVVTDKGRHRPSCNLYKSFFRKVG